MTYVKVQAFGFVPIHQHEIRRPLTKEGTTTSYCMASASNEERAYLDQAFRAAGATACAWIVAYRRWYSRVFAHPRILDDSTGHCGGRVRYSPIRADIHDADKKATMKKHLLVLEKSS